MVPAIAAVAPQWLRALRALFPREAEVNQTYTFVSNNSPIIPGCPNNAFAGPNSPFYYNNCPNAYAFPTNDGMIYNP